MPAPDERAERGLLAIADLSGYSDYLAGSELDHAQGVLRDLLETVVRGLGPMLRLSKLEGDAVFAYAARPDLDASQLLDGIEGCYFAFQRRRRDIRQATTCTCKACARIPTLDLKFVVHVGEFVRQVVVGHEELTGIDVVLVHRLLKNSVCETLGLEGYALFTAACVEALHMDPAALGLREHRERTDRDEVVAYVEDLQARWRYEEERRRVYLSREEAGIEIEQVLPAQPPVVWEYLTSPTKRELYQDLVISESLAGGRRGVGTITHCAHGSQGGVEEIVDWRPYHYFTYRSLLPVYGRRTIMYELEPVEPGTRLRTRSSRPSGLRQQLLSPLVGRFVVRVVRRRLARLAGLLSASAAT